MKNSIKILTLTGLTVVAAATTTTLVTGCAGNQYKESTGEYVDDSAITARVKKALHDDGQFKYDDIKVDTFKGTVQLSGFANSSDEKSRAADLAKGAPGVKDVVNNVTVKGQ